MIVEEGKKRIQMNWYRGVRDTDLTHNAILTIKEKDLIDEAREARILFGHKFETNISSELLDYMSPPLSFLFCLELATRGD